MSTEVPPITDKQRAAILLQLGIIMAEVAENSKLGFEVQTAVIRYLFGRMNYVANAQYEFIEATKAGWGEHVPESAAAEDDELARLRQRVAELEGLLQDALNAIKQLVEAVKE
jgi:hypothetical protein